MGKLISLFVPGFIMLLLLGCSINQGRDFSIAYPTVIIEIYEEITIPTIIVPIKSVSLPGDRIDCPDTNLTRSKNY